MMVQELRAEKVASEHTPNVKDGKLLISIIIPTFNSMTGNKRIDRLLDSIFNQTYKNVEVIVVDNFSKDATKAACEKYPVIFIQQKTTISAAWNIGLERATGGYILFLDSDMELRPKLLEEFVDLVKEQSVDCIQMDFECAESRKASLINMVEARNLELKMGAAPLNIYFYSKELIEDIRYPEDQNQIVGEEYIFRNKVLRKNPKTGKASTITLHYYDPSISWLAHRCLKYGKWFANTKRHLKSESAMEFVLYNSVFNRQAVKEIVFATKKQPQTVVSFSLYFFVKYISFALGYLTA